MPANKEQIKRIEKNIRARLEKIKNRSGLDNYEDEKLWNLMIYKSLIENGDLAKKMCKDNTLPIDGIDFVIEAEPMSPWAKEGNSKIDIAFGDISIRRDTDAGIEYKKPNGRDGWVCFVEGKIFSDCSSKTKNDPSRNQLTRVIENLLWFQNQNQYPDKLYFILLTPSYFKDKTRRYSRLYGYKMDDYADNEKIKSDIENSISDHKNDERRSYPGDKPDINGRLKALRVKWITYEEIFNEKDMNIVDILSNKQINMPQQITKMINQIVGR